MDEEIVTPRHEVTCPHAAGSWQICDSKAVFFTPKFMSLSSLKKPLSGYRCKYYLNIKESINI